MKKFRTHFIGFGVVTAWAVFSYAYIGVEDGSSGLSLLGWIHALFMAPGAFFFQITKGSHSNADLPLIAAISWLAFSILAFGITRLAVVACMRKKMEPRSRLDDSSL